MPNLRLTLQRATLSLVAGSVAVLCSAGLFEVALRRGIVANPRHDRLSLQGKRDGAEHRLLILGDSFVAQSGSLGPSLARALGSHDVAVMNTAVSGTGPFEYLSEMASVGVGFEPEVVLLSYYAGNDLTNVQNHTKFVPPGRADGRAGRAINRSATVPYLREIYLYQYLLPSLQLLRVQLSNARQMKAAGIPSELAADAMRLEVNPFLVQVAIHDENHLLDNILMETAENRRAWEKSKEILTEIHEICDRIGAQLVVAIFPHTLQVNASHYDFYEQLGFTLTEKALDSTTPQRLLVAYCEERGIRCLDLLPALRSRAADELYRDRDVHLNEAGNRLSEEKLLEFLLKETAIGK